VKFSVVPIFLLIIFGFIRTIVMVEVPGAVFIRSEVVYPFIIDVLRFIPPPFQSAGVPISLFNVFLCVWIVGAVYKVKITIQTERMRFDHDRVLMGCVVSQFPHCVESEAILKEIGVKKLLPVYRSNAFSTPGVMMMGMRQYLFMPYVDMPVDELRVVLKHEWWHIRHGDVAMRQIACVVGILFWWNPLIERLCDNFAFAQELKCDYYAVASQEDYLLLVSIFNRLGYKPKPVSRFSLFSSMRSLVDPDDGDDRLWILKARITSNRSRIKTCLVTTCSVVVVCALFLASYWITILPYRPVTAELGTVVEGFVDWSYHEDGVPFLPRETLIVDNGDGTFSVYLDGQFVQYQTGLGENFDLLPRGQ
jgi:hypothetical protein